MTTLRPRGSFPLIRRPVARRAATSRRLRLEPLEQRQMLAILMVGAGNAYATIQGAVDVARAGDIIYIDDGTYSESVDLSRMGSAVGRGPGDLTLRGAHPGGAVVVSPSGPDIFNSAPWVGDLVFEALTLRVVSGAADGGGINLQHVTGDVRVADSWFEQLPRTGFQLTSARGAVTVTGNTFRQAGSSGGQHGIALEDWTGVGTIADNVIEDASAMAVRLQNDGQQVASLLLSQNQLRGDASLFSTTQVGVEIVLAGASQTDLTLDGNQLADFAQEAVRVTAGAQTQLQMRWSRNTISNIQGAAAGRLTLGDNAAAAVVWLENSWIECAGDGLTVEVQDAAQLSAIVRQESFSAIGRGAGNEAVRLSTAANATGSVEIVADQNTFESVADNGLHLLVDGAGTVSARVLNNSFTEVNSVAAGAAFLAEQAVGASAALALRLASNNVAFSSSSAYGLRQQGSGSFSLEGTAATAAAAISQSNLGGPIAVTGSVGLIAPGTLDGGTPQLVGDTVWRDSDADGRQGTSENGERGVLLSLTGTAAAGGGLVARQTQTDGHGSYWFVGVSPGVYTVSLDVPHGLRLVTPDVGTDDALDSDFPPAAHAVVITLAEQRDEPTLDAGLWPTWQNPQQAYDVNADGFVTPSDVLSLVNEINNGGARHLLVPPAAPELTPPFWDVDGNDELMPLDVLLVINYLNAAAAGEGEGEGPASAQSGSGSDAAPRLDLQSRASAWPDTRAPSPDAAPREALFVGGCLDRALRELFAEESLGGLFGGFAGMLA
jgi:hypothetical protein